MAPEEKEQLLQNALAFGKQYAQIIGEPVNISDKDYKTFIAEQNTQLNLSWNKSKFLLFSNMKTENVEQSLGLKEVMGWTEPLSVEAYFRMIHPDYIAPYLYWSMAVYELGLEVRSHLKPMQQVFQIQLPLMHLSGTYYWCLMKGLPLRMDADNNLVEHLNIYVRMEELTDFNHRILEPILIERVDIMNNWTLMLREKMKKIVLSTLNNKEQEVMRHSLDGQKSEQIGKDLGVSIHTVMMYKKNILRRGQSFCGKVFRDADEVARYFRSMGWV
jgi:hypothetical protein